MPRTPPTPRLRIRIVLGEHGMLGPGKADLLELIRETGSIAAAGRRFGMSYKRAWTLIETINGMFAAPLVDSTRGGASHGGARLTETGERVLALYRAVSAKAAKAAAVEVGKLVALLAEQPLDMSNRK
jgi:molybdate transport system regulatory protein